ncbi:MAG: Ni/Fe hydrogenase subunit alpha [Deltaproteobacteria bacterium]|nr:Ni/Fe hydrogenase subunit alpha [Deltaproteobacteria bacterium]
MTRTIEIDPVTRIEGHAKVFIDLDDRGVVENAGMIVNELRGFERILVGMDASQMPLITARICGVCPTSHHLVASKALDMVTNATPPAAGALLRELMFMGHYIHSHALSLFVLQGPDLVLGLDASPKERNVVGVVKAAPDVATKALRLRTVGQKLNEMIGGRGVHPISSVAGGMSYSPDNADVKKIRHLCDEAMTLVEQLAPLAKSLLLRQLDSQKALLDSWHGHGWYMGTVKDGALNFYDGQLAVADDAGKPVMRFESPEYDQHLHEATLKWSYMKPVTFHINDVDQSYRVGPLARVKCADRIETPLASAELDQMNKAFGASNATILYTYARLIELIYACENAKLLAADKRLQDIGRTPTQIQAGRAVAHVEAPRGTLIHDYDIDDDGIVRSANLLVATQQNYNGINESVTQAAQSHVEGKDDNGLLNAVEFAIRCYDPCLSCATHAVGQMPLDIQVRQHGAVIRSVRRVSL